nr:folate family ECF transporter S component [Clostridia bacterium]
MRRPYWSVKSLATMALLCAMSVVLGTALSIKAIPLGGTYTVNVALNLLPVQFAGLLFGPVAGLLIGFVADFFKWLVYPLGAYHPGFSLSMAMMGFVPAFAVQLLQHLQKRDEPLDIRLIHEPRPILLARVTLWQLLLGVGAAQLLFSVGLNSYWIASMQGRAIWALLPVRVVNALVMIPIYSLLLRESARLSVRLGLV